MLPRRALALLACLFLAFGGVVAANPTASFASVAATTDDPPAPWGYFRLVPPGQFAELPDDAAAAGMVHYSAWEPRPSNAEANATMPPAGFTVTGYSGMLHSSEVFGRVTGHFTGTTDEIIQWAAAKWGLPDEVLRAEAVAESNWYQDLKDSSGYPIAGRGYGDFGDCGGSPPVSGYGTTGPASFGLLQDKWCTMQDADASSYGGWPWVERSTAFAVDLYGAVIRGCYEGWDTWLGDNYHAGDIWGCLGRWYAGQWYAGGAMQYVLRVWGFLVGKPWLTWAGS